MLFGEQKYAETPLMRQYYNIKAKHPEAILLFRVGDFYETFAEVLKVAEQKVEYLKSKINIIWKS